MDTHAAKLRDQRNELASTLASLDAEIAVLEKGCTHIWSVEFVPIFHRGYTVPPAATNEYVPYDLWERKTGYTVPDKYVDRWIRKCSKCGKLEETNTSQEVTTRLQDVTQIEKKPLWPSS